MESSTATTEQAIPPPRLRDTYNQEVLPKLMEKFGYTTPMRAPRLEKITLNQGHGSNMDTRAREKATSELALIAGQHPNPRMAKKSVAQFKVREGDFVRVDRRDGGAAGRATRGGRSEQARAHAV